MPEKYGFTGWREFLSTRTQILSEIDRAKSMNGSRPVQVEHGNAGEAAFRGWLRDFLPEKYGITAGYAIPDTIQTKGDQIRHYDVIIYDRFNSPKLWIDRRREGSSTDVTMAIPAKYIHAIFECKATFSKKTCDDSIKKLSEINEFSEHLPKTFHCGVVFFDASSSTPSRTITSLIPSIPITGFLGGIILRSDISGDACCNIQLLNSDTAASNVDCTDIPIAKAIEDLNIKKNQDGGFTIDEKGGGAFLFEVNYGEYHVCKQYGPIAYKNGKCVMLQWSNNGFARFAIDTIHRLEGRQLTDRVAIFGQVFDSLS
jgi:hypothetical protein